MDALLLLVPQARALNHHGLGDFHMDAPGISAAASAAMLRLFVFTRIPDGFETFAPRCAEGPFSTNILWTPASRKAGAFGPSTRTVVRRRTPQSFQ